MIWSAWLRGDAEAIRRLDRRMHPDLLGRPGEGLRSNLAVFADLESDTASLREHAIRLAGSALEPRLSHFASTACRPIWWTDAPMGRRHVSRSALPTRDALSSQQPRAAGRSSRRRSSRGRGVASTTRCRSGSTRSAKRFSIAERVPALAFGAVRAAHLGHLDEADGHIAEIRRVTPPGAGRDLLAGMLAVAEATALTARGDEPAAVASFAANLGPACERLKWNSRSFRRVLCRSMVSSPTSNAQPTDGSGQRLTSSRLMTDVGDLAAAIQRVDGLRPRRDAEPITELRHEIGDCLWVLLVLADRYRIDVTEAFNSTMDNIEAWLDSTSRQARAIACRPPIEEGLAKSPNPCD